MNDLRDLLGDAITLSTVNKAARAMYEHRTALRPDSQPWNLLDISEVGKYRDLADVALAAVLPDLLARAWDEGLCVGRAVVPPETPAPVDLTYLSDRARAYVMGLEAKLRELHKLAGELKPDERHLKRAYRDGYEACAAEVMEKSRGLVDALRSARAAGLDAYATAWKAEPESAENGEPR